MTGRVVYLSPDSRPPREGGNGQAVEAQANSGRTSPSMFQLRIEMDVDSVGQGELRGAVKLGLGGTAEIVTDRESLLMIFFRKIRQSISLG